MTRFQRSLALAVALTAALVLSSCSQSDTGSSTVPSASPSASDSSSDSASASAGRRIDITVTGRQVTPTPSLVNIAVGDSLTITVTSDHDDTLHAHGFNVEEDVKASQVLEITVTGAEPGVYDIELHDPELRLLQVAVR